MHAHNTRRHTCAVHRSPHSGLAAPCTSEGCSWTRCSVPGSSWASYRTLALRRHPVWVRERVFVYVNTYLCLVKQLHTHYSHTDTHNTKHTDTYTLTTPHQLHSLNSLHTYAPWGTCRLCSVRSAPTSSRGPRWRCWGWWPVCVCVCACINHVYKWVIYNVYVYVYVYSSPTHSHHTHTYLVVSPLPVLVADEFDQGVVYAGAVGSVRTRIHIYVYVHVVSKYVCTYINIHSSLHTWRRPSQGRCHQRRTDSAACRWACVLEYVCVCMYEYECACECKCMW
jgi:hypothetical protein